MRKPLLLLLLLLIFAYTRPVSAQEDAELRLTLRRDFGYASGSGDIQGAFTIRASGPEDLQRVVFYLDGEQLGEAAQPPFELRFHTESYPLGAHTLSAVGFTASGQEVSSNLVKVGFVSANEGFQSGMRIVLPLFGVVFGLIVLSFVFSFVTAGKLKNLPPGTPRSYGAAGGAICPRCGRPFSRHFLSINLLVGKLERCPFCGKWSILAAQPLANLRAAEVAELEGTSAAPSTESESERLRKELDQSRYLRIMSKPSRLRFPVLLMLVVCLGWACNFFRYSEVPETPVPSLDLPSVGATPEPASSPPPSIEPAVTQELEAATPAAGALQVVYTKDSNLWLWKDGSSHQFTVTGDAYNPSISPNGQTVAFLRPAGDFHTELWAIDLDGANERRLVSITDLDTIGGGVRDPSAVAINPYHYAWVPGTRSLAFNTQQVFDGPGLSLLDDLNLVDADSGKITNLFLAGWGGEFVYSPDGSQVAISKPDMLILANADGSNYRPVLHYDPVLTYSEYRYYATPLWSQDGEFLRAAIPPVESLASPAQPTMLWKIPTDGSSPVQEGTALAVPFFDQPLRYSPDLERLAFLRETGQPSENRRELVLTTYDGNGEWAYVAGPLMHFESWSPDNRHFVYTLGDEQEAWLGSLDNAPQTLEGDRYGVSNLQWISPDQIIYVIQRGETFDLYLRELKSGALLLDTTTGVPPVYDLIR